MTYGSLAGGEDSGETMSEDKELKVCPKCRVNHKNPGSKHRAIQVIACALGEEFDFVTAEGPVGKPHAEAGIG